MQSALMVQYLFSQVSIMDLSFKMKCFMKNEYVIVYHFVGTSEGASDGTREGVSDGIVEDTSDTADKMLLPVGAFEGI